MKNISSAYSENLLILNLFISDNYKMSESVGADRIIQSPVFTEFRLILRLLISNFKCIREMSSSLLIMVMAIGCLWQSISIIQIYTSYPTQIEIITEFDLYEDSLPSLTFCKKTNRHDGKNTEEIFNYYRTIEIIAWISLGSNYVSCA